MTVNPLKTFCKPVLTKKKKKTHNTRGELSFTWSKMRTVGWETASQTVLRNYPKEVVRKVSIYVILLKGDTRKQAHILAEVCC